MYSRLNGETEILHRRIKKRKNPWNLMLLIILFSGSALGGVIFYLEKLPNSQHVQPFEGVAYPVVADGELWENAARMDGDQILLSFQLVKSLIDPYIFWDAGTKSVIITTENKVLRLPNGQLQAFVNEKPFQLSMPVRTEGNEVFIPFEPLGKIYPFHVKYYPETGVTVIDQLGKPVQMAEVTDADQDGQGMKPLRSGPSRKEPIFADLSIGEQVRVLGEEQGWYYVMSDKGITGYMEKSHLRLAGIKDSPLPEPQKKYIPWNPLGKKINLTWEHVIRDNPDTGMIPELTSLNVISPTWFEIKDEKGNIRSKADLEYVKWAHQKGYQVWALIANGFNPDRTHAFLSNYETRRKIIRQMIEYAHLYDLDGYNIDFENVYLKDKELLVQFVRELTPYLHERGLVVSIDVTVKSQSENWSMVYDRKSLGDTVDYMIVMTYDEHWATSPKAGSVASLPWVENGLKGILEEVPPHKVLLGVPFYTRLWKETKDETGRIKVSQQAFSMQQAKKWLADRGLKPVFDESSGQYYAEYYDAKENATYKIWLEDETSIRKRAELVKKYNLAGIASWRRGFESENIWKVIKETLEKLP